MTVSVRARSGGFLCDIRFRWPDGGRFRERIQAPVASKSGALRWGQAREGALLAGGRAALEAPAPCTVPTLAVFWPRFVQDHYRANRKKASTIDAAETAFRVHLAPRLGTRRLDAVSNADIAALKGALADKRPKTVNNVLAVLSRCLRAAVEWGVLERLPCKVGMLAAPATERLWYEVEDYRKIVEAARRISTGHLVLVLLAGSAGLRRGEIRALKWSDLDTARRMIKVGRALWRAEENTPKGGRGRLVPMTPELAAALTKHRHLTGDRVLYSRTGAEISNRTVRNWLGEVLRAARLPVATTPEGKNRRDIGAIHALRHTFCSHLAAAGVPAKAIQELAGHADLSTTMRYMHLAPGDRDGAMRVLEGYYAGGGVEEQRRTG